MLTTVLIIVAGVALMAAAMLACRLRRTERRLAAVRGDRDLLRLHLKAARARLGEVDGVLPFRRTGAL